MTASGEIQIDTSALATNTNSCTSILINMLFFKACSKYTVHDKCTTYALGKVIITKIITNLFYF